MVRSVRGTRPGREILDRAIWLQYCDWPGADRRAPVLSESMDLAGRLRRIADFLAQPALEYPLPLALRSTHASDSRRRPGCRAPGRGILRAADAAASPAHHADLDHGMHRSAGGE